MSRREEDRDHLPVEIGPGRLAVQAEDGVSAGRSLVEVVDPEAVDVEVVRGERVAGKAREPTVGGAKALDHGSLPHALIGQPAACRNHRLVVRRSLTAREPAPYKPPTC